MDLVILLQLDSHLLAFGQESIFHAGQLGGVGIGPLLEEAVDLMLVIEGL